MKQKSQTILIIFTIVLLLLLTGCDVIKDKILKESSNIIEAKGDELDNDETNNLQPSKGELDNDEKDKLQSPEDKLDNYVTDKPQPPVVEIDNDQSDKPPSPKDEVDTDEIDKPLPPKDELDNDESDIPVLPQCSDTIDNDGDSLIDFPSDPGCTDALDDNETDLPPPKQCSDTIDNDGDSLIDFPSDSGCTDALDDDEIDIPPPPPLAFSSSYRGRGLLTSLCTRSLGINGMEPSEPGSYPVAVYTVGTFASYDQGKDALKFIEEMAKRGFIAASVEYPNLRFEGCGVFHEKANCIYSPSLSNSAVSVLCSRPNADCTKGIVTSGMSQGSIIAALAKDHDSRVRATYGLGSGNDEDFSGLSISSCMDAGNKALPANRFRVIDGEHDNQFGATPDVVRGQLEAITGISCGSSAYSCFREDDSGWYMVKDTEVIDGFADHCYYNDGGDNGFGCLPNLAYDSGWIPPSSFPWSISTSLDWLASFTD